MRRESQDDIARHFTHPTGESASNLALSNEFEPGLIFRRWRGPDDWRRRERGTVADSVRLVGAPQWIERFLKVKPGSDRSGRRPSRRSGLRLQLHIPPCTERAAAVAVEFVDSDPIVAHVGPDLASVRKVDSLLRRLPKAVENSSKGERLIIHQLGFDGPPAATDGSSASADVHTVSSPRGSCTDRNRARGVVLSTGVHVVIPQFWVCAL